MPFTASTLQIGDYHSYQHRNPQAAQVTITEPEQRNSAVRLCDCDLSYLQLAVLVAVLAFYLQSGSREWHLSGRPRRTYNLLFVCRDHTQGHFPVEAAV